MSPEQMKRLLELEYLLLEFKITPPDQRPLRARVLHPKWRAEFGKLKRIAEREGYLVPEAP